MFYLHGFSEKAPGGKGSSAQEIRDAFLDVDDYNVILVDWSPLTAMPWYANSVQNGPKVGRYMARFLHFLLKNGVELDSIHVIGFSLGAEVAGFIGKTLKEWGFLLPRITGKNKWIFKQLMENIYLNCFCFKILKKTNERRFLKDTSV